MSESLFWGAVLRVAQALMQAGPFILIGLVITAVFRSWLGHYQVRRIFGVGTWRERKHGWIAGMLLPVFIGLLLPVCSLGVIPIMRQMQRAGLAIGTILAFGLAAPLFNPLSILYGLTLSEPFIILTFCFCAMLVATGISGMFDFLFSSQSTEVPDESRPGQGLKRILAVLVSGSRELWSRSTLYILVGLAGVALLSIVLPKGAFQSSVNGDNPLAPLLMTSVALPVYATPMLAVSQLGMMFQHGNSVGAAFVLLILGAGVNLGILAWAGITLGWKRAACWLGMLLLTVLALGYTLEKPLYPQDIEPANHTHAFDIYCAPFEANQTGLASEVWRKLKDDIRPEELFALILLLGLGAVGGILKLAEKWVDLEGWLVAEPSETRPSGRYDIVLPKWAIGLSIVGGLLFFSGAMCFAYYPDPEECLEEIFVVKAEVLAAARSGDKEHALYWLPIWEDWNRRLQVGLYLRQGHLSDYHKMKARIVRDELEFLEHALEEEDTEAILKHSIAVNRAQSRLAKAYRNLSP